MRSSQYLISTLKETPADAEVISHQLMLRAGMVRKIASGLYTWLPMGLKVLRKIEAIVRDEMNKSGALEVLMPMVQPAELWEESGRLEQYGPELLRFEDRHHREFCLGPTHEEVITDLIRNELNSYKQLPANFYQIQTKFRDEIRPRFGIMRSREFLMKDAYSFHITQESLQQTYDIMYQTYTNIFNRLELNFRAVMSDSGSIGGNNSHEFHVLASSGEDAIAFSDSSDYAANIEKAEALAPEGDRPAAQKPCEKISTPNTQSIEDVCQFFKTSADKTVKTLIVLADNPDNIEPAPLIALVLRGDHELNAVKAENLPQVHTPLTFASETEIKEQLACNTGSIGPINLKFTTLVDRSAAQLSDFICGANENDHHYSGVNWERDLEEPVIHDLRSVVEGDPSPDGKGKLLIKRGIEVGHIFQLGDKYSKALKATVLDENGKEQVMTMGCYGIGVSRLIAASIEQNNDDKGIIWPDAIAPFQIALIPINLHKSEQVKTLCDKLYTDLSAAGIDVLFFDEAKARLGNMLSNVELMGIPHRLVIGDKGIEKGSIEYGNRRSGENEDLPLESLLEKILEKMSYAINSIIER